LSNTNMNRSKSWMRVLPLSLQDNGRRDERRTAKNEKTGKPTTDILSTVNRKECPG